MEKLLKLSVLLLLLLLQQQAASHSTVEYLPGLPGRLPFPLETGYVGVGEDEELQLFYYFLESESEPTTDPLLIWLPGGPGCSAVTAIVNGIGPLRFVEQVYDESMPSFVLNPHAWTNIASVIFLDQPINTGFSYVTNEAAYKQTDVQAFAYVYEFIRKWLNDHPKYISNPFYMSGNSYAGKMIPVVAQLISNGNTAGKEPFVNLQGYLMGSPGTFRPQEDNYQVLFSYGMGLISDELYKSLEKNCGGEYTNIDPNNKGCANDFLIFKQLVKNINGEHILEPFCTYDYLQGPYQMSGERRLLDDKLISLQRQDKCADELLWGAAWLHKATRRRQYREYIVKNEVILRAGDTINEFGWDNKHAGINVLISKEVLMGKAPDLKSFQVNADAFICSILPGISHPQVQYSPGGLIVKPGVCNMQHVTSLSFLLLTYSNYLSHANHVVPCGSMTATPALLKHIAKRQVDYILGDNPQRMSYMVGYGPHYPQRIHHRGSSVPSVATHSARIGCKEGSRYFFSPNPNPNRLIGAVVGGPNLTDSFPDARSYFQESEPTTYVNAPLVGLLAYFAAHSN